MKRTADTIEERLGERGLVFRNRRSREEMFLLDAYDEMHPNDDVDGDRRRVGLQPYAPPRPITEQGRRIEAMSELFGDER